MAANNARELSKESTALRVKVNVDISEALTGLKALQREAKKATQALRELEGATSITVTDSRDNVVAAIDGDEAIVKDGYKIVGYGGEGR